MICGVPHGETQKAINCSLYLFVFHVVIHVLE